MINNEFEYIYKLIFIITYKTNRQWKLISVTKRHKNYSEYFY